LTSKIVRDLLKFESNQCQRIIVSGLSKWTSLTAELIHRWADAGREEIWHQINAMREHRDPNAQ
jgi:hypothetical protein